jgi:hypothetical protein
MSVHDEATTPLEDGIATAIANALERPARTPARI